MSKNTFVLLDRIVKDLRMGANVSEFWCWVLSTAKIKVPLSTLIGQTGKNAMYRSTAITDDLKCHDESKRVRTLHISWLVHFFMMSFISPFADDKDFGFHMIDVPKSHGRTLRLAFIGQQIGPSHALTRGVQG